MMGYMLQSMVFLLMLSTCVGELKVRHNQAKKLDPSEEDIRALDMYAMGRGVGDPNIVLSVLDRSYTFTMSGMEEPVNMDGFVEFFNQFRADVEAAGGPSVDSDQFMKFTSVIRKQVGDILVEAGKFEVPGFATGCYMVGATNGRIIWAEAV